jgi:hypothetical protein
VVPCDNPIAGLNRQNGEHVQNLAGVEEATRLAALELAEAGIAIVAAAKLESETRCQIQGELRAWDRVARFTRKWAYWSVTVSPPLSAELAVALNEAPGVEGRSKYSGSESRLGSTVRAHGFAGGMSTNEVREWGSCGTWHIDTSPALKAFAEWFVCNGESETRIPPGENPALVRLAEDVVSASTSADLQAAIFRLRAHLSTGWRRDSAGRARITP